MISIALLMVAGTCLLVAAVEVGRRLERQDTLRRRIQR